MASMALLQPSWPLPLCLTATIPVVPCELHLSLCQSLSPHLTNHLFASVLPGLSSGGQRYMNVNSSSVSILETGTLRLRELITVQGHRENKRQSRCRPAGVLSPVPFSLPSRSLSSLRLQEPGWQEPDLSGESCLPGISQEEEPSGAVALRPKWARQASYRVGLTARGQQAKQKGRATGPLGKLNFIPSSLL